MHERSRPGRSRVEGTQERWSKNRQGYIHRYNDQGRSDLFVTVTFCVTKHTLLAVADMRGKIVMRSGRAAVEQRGALHTNSL